MSKVVPAALASLLTLSASTCVVAQSAPTADDAELRGGLATIVNASRADQFIPISVVLAARPERDAWRAAGGANRAATIAYLRAAHDVASTGVDGVIGRAVQADAARSVRDLWLAGAIALDAQPAAIHALAAHPDVAWINYDRPVRHEIFPIEPEAPAEGGGGSIECGTDLIGAPEVWSTYDLRGSGIVVAVIDTGACTTHPDLASHLWSNDDEIPGNGIDDDRNGYVDDMIGWNFRDSNNNPADDNGHGTHVSGTVLGDGTNGTQTGVAPEASLMTLKIWNNYSGESLVWEAMQYAVDNDADIMSVSLGWPFTQSPDRATWRMSCEAAIDAGVTVVYAAGNFGATPGYVPPDNVTTPGDVPDLITVGATSCSDDIASFSGRGPVSWEFVSPYFDHPFPPGLMKPNVSAPGSGTLSTSFNCSGYTFMSGTSMATPHVAGAAALMLQANPALTPMEVRSILEDTALDLGDAGYDNVYGAGRVDVLAAVEAALALSDPADLDGSGAVDFNDLLIVLAAWGPCGTPCPADLSGNGTVDFADVLALLAAWS